MRTPSLGSRALSAGATNVHLTAILEEEGDGFFALCPELDVASQGGTLEEATENLREAVELFLACADPGEVASRLKSRVFVTHFEAHGGAAWSTLGP